MIALIIACVVILVLGVSLRAVIWRSHDILRKKNEVLQHVKQEHAQTETVVVNLRSLNQQQACENADLERQIETLRQRNLSAGKALQIMIKKEKDLQAENDQLFNDLSQARNLVARAAKLLWLPNTAPVALQILEGGRKKWK